MGNHRLARRNLQLDGVDPLAYLTATLTSQQLVASS